MPLPSPTLYPSPDLYPGGETELTNFTPSLIASFQPWLDNDPVGDYETYLTALAAMFEPIAQIVMDNGFPGQTGFQAGWSVLLDPVNCPTEWLPYLGQFVGVDIPPGMNGATARQLIMAEAGMKRGTAPSMIAAAQRYLADTQTVLLRERTSAAGGLDPYHFVMIVRPEELTVSMTELIAAVENVKPAGLQGTYLDVDGYPWNSAINDWSMDAFSWAAAWNTQP